MDCMVAKLAIDPAAVRAQLARMEACPVFETAGRMAPLLRYLVEAELAGEAGALNQARIAIDVMGRDAHFDPATDSIVRVEIGRLRGKLLEYYATAGKDDAIIIDLPKGRYRPTIRMLEQSGAPKAARLHQEVRLCLSEDGHSIAYATSGSGYPLVKASTWLTHLEFDNQSPVWRHWWTDLSKRFRLVRYDPLGCGMSDWDVGDVNFESWLKQLELVVNAAGLEKFALFGPSQGAAIAIAYAVKHPERVSHLILYGGYAEGALARNNPEHVERWKLLAEMVRVGWGRREGAFRRAFGAIFMPNGTLEQFEWFDDLAKASMSAENALKFRYASAVINVTPLLGEVRAPTLILHAKDEVLVPFSEAKWMAARIPGARLVPLDSSNHLILPDERAWTQFLDEVEGFVLGP